jgi:hypothetical protein
MKRSISLILLFVGYTTICVAQIKPMGQTLGDSPIDNPAYAEVGGNAYLPLTFEKAHCIRQTGESDTLFVRFDMYAGYWEVMQGNKVLISKNRYKQVTLDIPDEGIAIFRNGFGLIDDLSGAAFYQVLYDGKTKLLKHISASKSECYNYGGIYKQCFKASERFYIQKSDGSLLRVDTNKELIWGVFGASQNQVKTYTSQNKLRIKRWPDVCKILQYFDSI